MSRRLAWMTAILVLALGLQSYNEGAKAPELPLHDFVEYWAAGQLLARGNNPYDLMEMDRLLKQAGREEASIPRRNPPWTLPLVLPLGWLEVRTGRLLWLGLNLLALVVAADLLWRVYQGSDTVRLLAVVLALAFVPSVSALIVGQISPLLLLGAAGFLWFISQEQEFEAGVVSTLLPIKPHMSYLFWMALLVWAVGTRRWKLLVGGALTGVTLTLIAAAFRPSILTDYWQTAQTPPAGNGPLELSFLLRLRMESPSFAWQYVLLLGLVWLGWYGWHHRIDWNWPRQMPWLLLVSALTAVYDARLFDLVVLLVPLLDVAARISQLPFQATSASPEQVRRTWRLAGGALAVYLLVFAAGLARMLAPSPIQHLHYIWITPVTLLAYLGLDLALRSRYSHLPRT